MHSKSNDFIFLFQRICYNILTGKIFIDIVENLGTEQIGIDSLNWALTLKSLTRVVVGTSVNCN